jgi:hypothetical protein
MQGAEKIFCTKNQKMMRSSILIGNKELGDIISTIKEMSDFTHLIHYME